MSIIDALITDRTQADVSRAAYLREVVNSGTATADELTEWGTDLKGAYNASDWNRVGEACAYLYQIFRETFATDVPGYVALRTDWGIFDIPTATEMGTYLGTVAALKGVWNTAQEIPSSMSHLTTDDANNIEKLLIEIDTLQKNAVRSFVFSGMVYSGQIWAQIGG